MRTTYRDLLRHIARRHTRILRYYERDGHVSAVVDLGWAVATPDARGWELTDAGRAVLAANPERPS